MIATEPPVIGERWTDHPHLPHGTRAQVCAWLLTGLRPGRLVVVTATDRSLSVKLGQVGFAHCMNDRGHLGRQHAMNREEFMRTFRRVPDEAPHPQDVPPEVTR